MYYIYTSFCYIIWKRETREYTQHLCPPPGGSLVFLRVQYPGYIRRLALALTIA